MLDISLFTVSRCWPLITRIAGLLDEWKIPAYVVGGWVRDCFSGRDTDDLDLAVKADGLEIAERIAIALNGKYVPLDKANRVGRVVIQDTGATLEKQLTIDTASYHEDIERDLERRDFTIDAMAIKLGTAGKGVSGDLIDPFHGLKDLENKIVRAVAGNAFQDDPVRLLRAVRLAVTLHFIIDPATESMIMRDAPLISGIAGERVREELLQILKSPNAGNCLEYLDRLHLLTNMFSELELSRGFSQPQEHYWDVLNHSLKTVVALDGLLHQGRWEYADEDILNEAPWSDEMQGYFAEKVGHDSTRSALSRLGALFHDVAKPVTMTAGPGGRTRFLGHALEGVKIVADMLERLRFSTREISYVATLVKYHLRPTQMGLPEMPSRRAIYRFYRDAAGAAVGVLFLSLADHLATRGPSLDHANWKLHTQTVAYILAHYPETGKRLVRLIDGYDIMDIFSLGPGPLVGELLELVQEAQAAGEVTSKDEALKLVAKLLSARSGAK